MTKREKEIFICAYNGAIARASIMAAVDDHQNLAKFILKESVKDEITDWPCCETGSCCRLLGHEFNGIPHGPYDPNLEEL